MELETYLESLDIKPNAEQLGSGIVVERIRSPPHTSIWRAVDAISLLAPQRAVDIESRCAAGLTRRTMRRGDISITPPLAEVEVRYGALDAVMGWIATPVIVNVARAIDPMLANSLCFRFVHRARDTLLSSLAIELSDEFGRTILPQPTYREALRTALTGRIIQRYGAQVSERRPWGTSREDARIGRTIAYLERQFTHRLNIVEVARHVGLSPAHLRQVFKAATGETIQECVRRRRFQLARELLANTDLSIADIAERVGYASAAHFATAFKAASRISPGALRRKMRVESSRAAG